MNTYIALLRGINVSGQKKILMADLKVHLEELGWIGIQTYIQSGNIIFNSADTDPEKHAQKIKQKLQDKYGFEVPTLILEPPALKHIIQHNPFTRDPGTAVDRLAVTFLFETPQAELVKKIMEPEQTNEYFTFYEKFIFLYYPDGFGRAMMNNNAFEKALQVEATSRNWKTVNKLYEMTQS
jgi:uncharacterized protein (DUF1697 family)